MEPYQERLKTESAELTDRLEKLTAFLGSDTHAELGAEEQLDLLEQHAAMSAYSSVLTRRIQRAGL